MELVTIPNCEITKNSLIIKESINKEQWDQIGIVLKTMEKSIQFWIGDWLRFGEKKWGEMYKEAEEITGLAYDTLASIKSVSGSVESCRRRQDLSFSHHEEVASLEPEQQEIMLDKAEQENLSVREIREEVKKIKRGDENRTQQELPNKKYQIIYADPPWKYYKDQEYFGQDAERHYPTMTEEELADLPIKGLADDNCVLYLWTTAPKLNRAFEIINAWGFDYKTCMIWDKVKHNMGFYASIRHEILIIAGRGSSAPTDKSAANQTDSVYVEERTEHSKKPEYFYGMIERLHPEKKNKIELFARNKRDDWDCWGNEI